MKKILLSLAFLSALSPLSPARAQTALEIVTGFETQKIAALQSYLADHPEAPDKDQALAMLVGAHMVIGKPEPIPDLLLQRYDAQPKGLDANLQVIVQEIARPLIEASIVSNQRDKAKAFITRVKTDLADHPQSPQIGQFLDQVGGDLYLPGVGDEMKIAFTDLKGVEVDLEKMKDKVILVDFWATWCGPCIKAMPDVLAAVEAFPEGTVAFRAVNQAESAPIVSGFLEARKWESEPVVLDFNMKVSRAYQVEGIPHTVVIDPAGKIAWVHTGYSPDLKRELFEAIAGILSRGGPAR